MNANSQEWEIKNYDGLGHWISILVTAKDQKYLVRKSTSKGVALFAKSKGYSNFSEATEVRSEEDGSYSRLFAFHMNEQEKDNDVNGRCSGILLDNAVIGGEIKYFYAANTKMLKLQTIQANKEKYLSIKVFTKDENEVWNRVERLFLSPTKLAQLIEILGSSLADMLNSTSLMNNAYQHSDRIEV